MYMQAIVTACLATMVVVTVYLTSFSSGIKKDLDNKMRGIVDQVNSSQFYQYELEKRSYDKLNSIDANITNVRNKYVPKDDVSERVVTNLLDVTNIQQHGGNASFKGSTNFGNDVTFQAQDSKLNVNIPLKSSININSSSGKDSAVFDGQQSAFKKAKADKLQIGDKFMLSGVGDAHGDDGWLRFFDKDGQDYYGGIATANLWTRDNAYLNGATHITGQGNVHGNLFIRGGDSEHNPDKWWSHFPYHDGKNYIRGDTEIRGNTNNVGDLTVGRNMNVDDTLTANKIRGNNIKLGHNWGGWTDQTPLSVYSDDIGFSAGGPEYWSHFSFKGDTYIRPGKGGGRIAIGDVGNTSAIELGDRNTKTMAKGPLCVQDVCISGQDLTKIKQQSGL